MLSTLHYVEFILPHLLIDREGWSSKCIDYTPPFVHRLYRDIEFDDKTHRVYLHKIFPCERAFFHPHPWPSAIRVLPVPGSTYEMGVGFSPNERHDPPPYAATLRVQNGFEYEMTHPDGWHHVRVIGEPSMSVMVSGPVWDRPGGAPRTAVKDFRPLTEDEESEIFDFVRTLYP